MKLHDAAALSAGNLYRSPLRTLLTVLGLGVGIGAILAVLALGSAGEKQVEAEIARMGVNKVWITGDMRREDSAAAAAAIGTDACAGAYTMTVVRLGEHVESAQVVGYDSGAEQVHQPVLREGRLFLPGEYESGAACALVDAAFDKHMGGDTLGRYIDLGNRRFTVVGVVETAAPQTLAQSAGCVTLPLSAFLDTFDVPIRELTLNVPSGMQADEAAAAALAVLPGNSSDYETASLQSEIDAARQVIRIFILVLACVAAVCMLTGCIGVMNMLLVSVRERRGEIGLLKAIGATESHIAVMFLLEAALYGLTGGLLGLTLGVLMIRIFSSIVGVAAHLDPSSALVIWAVSLLISAAFGVAPAIAAARLPPAEALKPE